MHKYALVGAGQRSLDFGPPIYERFSDIARVVGIADSNRVRAEFISQKCGSPQVFTDFDQMLAATNPDTVIVTTSDRYHHEFVIQSLEAGCHVIVEKPMTIDDVKCRAILAAERRTGKKVTVTFNYRFAPYTTRIKELVKEGIIGQVMSVDFEWLLDTSHGADYFRRWHRRLENSGGLLVHKATHHFDIINWWLNDYPDEVFGFGDRRFYGPTRPERGERCLTCRYKRTCEFYVDYTSDPLYKALYFDAEHQDGYHRDQCVFSPEIDIYDTMSVNVRYRNGCLLNYSLIAHCPYEGWRASLNGTGGRIEIQEFHSGHSVNEPNNIIRVFNRQGEEITYTVPKIEGVHGGSDVRLVERLFRDQDLPDPLNHMAGSFDGAMSVLLGVAGNHSIATGKPVFIKDLLSERPSGGEGL